MKNFKKSIVLPLISIILGELLLVLLFWLYLMIYFTVETVFYPVKPQSVPAGMIRTISCLFIPLIGQILLNPHY